MLGGSGGEKMDKIIRIKTCFDCPHYDLIEGVLKTGSYTGICKLLDEKINHNSSKFAIIAKCPLEIDQQVFMEELIKIVNEMKTIIVEEKWLDKYVNTHDAIKTWMQQINKVCEFRKQKSDISKMQKKYIFKSEDFHKASLIERAKTH